MFAGDQVTLGPAICIFESAAKDNDVGKGFLKELRKRKLDKGLIEPKHYIDTSYNGWLNDNMLASIRY